MASVAKPEVAEESTLEKAVAVRALQRQPRKAVTGTARGKPDKEVAMAAREVATAAREVATTTGRAATAASTSVTNI